MTYRHTTMTRRDVVESLRKGEPSRRLDALVAEAAGLPVLKLLHGHDYALEDGSGAWCPAFTTSVDASEVLHVAGDVVHVHGTMHDDGTPTTVRVDSADGVTVSTSAPDLARAASAARLESLLRRGHLDSAGTLQDPDRADGENQLIRQARESKVFFDSMPAAKRAAIMGETQRNLHDSYYPDQS